MFCRIRRGCNVRDGEDAFALGVARHYVRGSETLQTQLELVLCTESPSLHTAFAQVACKLNGEPVKSEHPFGLDEIDVPKQVVVISVIREGKRGVNLVAIDRIWIDCPASGHGHALVSN